MAFDQGHADALAEVEVLRQELADALAERDAALRALRRAAPLLALNLVAERFGPRPPADDSRDAQARRRRVAGEALDPRWRGGPA